MMERRDPLDQLLAQALALQTHLYQPTNVDREGGIEISYYLIN